MSSDNIDEYINVGPYHISKYCLAINPAIYFVYKNDKNYVKRMLGTQLYSMLKRENLTYKPLECYKDYPEDNYVPKFDEPDIKKEIVKEKQIKEEYPEATVKGWFGYRRK